VSLRFLLDEDMSPRVAEGLRARGIDVVSVHEIGRGNRRIPDEERLAYATSEARVFVTYNRGDFQALDAAWRRQGRQHAGILWCLERSIPRRAIGDLIRAVETAATEYTDLTGFCLPLRRSTDRGAALIQSWK
jgi:predicted nuclease of predicted toxin-antitoxin system